MTLTLSIHINGSYAPVVSFLQRLTNLEQLAFEFPYRLDWSNGVYESLDKILREVILPQLKASKIVNARLEHSLMRTFLKSHAAKLDELKLWYCSFETPESYDQLRYMLIDNFDLNYFEAEEY